MRARVVGVALAGLGIATAAVLSPLAGMASAGHENEILSAKLRGKHEVGKKGDKNGRGEVTIFGVDGDDKTLCYVLNVDKVKRSAKGLAAHIHAGKKGKNGDVVVNLAAPGDGDAADCLTEGEKNPTTGADVFPTGAKVADILAKPKNFYVNVHTTQFPDGAIRGQLKKDS